MLVVDRTNDQGTAERILSAAEALFLERNYADVTVTQVAEAADLTKGAVYHHFPSKEQLYVAMLQADFSEKNRLYQQVAVDYEGTCEERLQRLTRAFFSLPERKRRLISLIRRDINIFPDTIRDEMVRKYQAALPDLIEEIIRDGVRDGLLVPCDPRLLAWQFVALVEVLLTPYAEQSFRRDEDTVNYIVRMFLDGCSRQRCQGER
ncbi:MAG: TetR/AcrR family transcriptional regulator [Arenicellales bacterium]|jgi:AcrR family transcriptional regulator|nr:TetR/AcrR family transcriptional regulator [Arenicellales bacterium]